MTFRDRLLSTLRAVQPILDTDGVLVAGSEIPNLLQEDAEALVPFDDDIPAPKGS